MLFSKTSSLNSVDELRKELFCRDSKLMEALPPKTDALFQHAKRAAYQATIWTASHKKQQRRPTPSSWGWKLDESLGTWRPIWITNPIAARACSERIKCNCKSENGCGSRCSCRKSNWNCTELCKCNCNTS